MRVVRVVHASSARSLPLSAASLRLKDEAAASSVHAAKAREQRRPVHEGTTASGKVPNQYSLLINYQLVHEGTTASGKVPTRRRGSLSLSRARVVVVCLAMLAGASLRTGSGRLRGRVREREGRRSTNGAPSAVAVKARKETERSEYLTMTCSLRVIMISCS